MRRHSCYGLLELIEGVLLIILGILSIVMPGNVMRWFTILYGIMAAATGISDIIFYAKTVHYVGIGPSISLISGVLSILAGMMLLVYPHTGELIVVLLLPIWFIAHSISRLTHLPRIRMLAGKSFFIFSMVINILGIILGILMIFWPQIAVFSVGFVIGGYLIMLGVDSIVIACSKMDSGWL